MTAGHPPPCRARESHPASWLRLARATRFGPAGWALALAAIASEREALFPSGFHFWAEEPEVELESEPIAPEGGAASSEGGRGAPTSYMAGRARWDQVQSRAGKPTGVVLLLVSRSGPAWSTTWRAVDPTHRAIAMNLRDKIGRRGASRGRSTRGPRTSSATPRRSPREGWSRGRS